MATEKTSSNNDAGNTGKTYTQADVDRLITEARQLGASEATQAAVTAAAKAGSEVEKEARERANKNKTFWQRWKTPVIGGGAALLGAGAGYMAKGMFDNRQQPGQKT